MTLDPSSTYSFRIVQVGSNTQFADLAPYTDLQTFATTEQWAFTDFTGDIVGPYDTKDECDTTRQGQIDTGSQPQTECLPYTGGHICPPNESWNTTTSTCIPTPVVTPTNDTTVTPAGGLVPCSINCGFKELLQLVNNFIKFILFVMAVPIAALMFVYAGFEMVTSGGSVEKAKKAKNVFTNAAIGLTLAAASWLIIELILSTLGYSGSWIGF